MDLTEFDNIILLVNKVKENVDEQYDNENIRLTDTIIELTGLLKDRESKIKKLEKQVENNNFNEDNYNRVSILRTLSKENDDLKKQNEQLLNSLNFRNVKDNNEVSEEPLAEPVVKPLAEPVVKPLAEPVVKPLAEPVEELVEVEELVAVEELVVELVAEEELVEVEELVVEPKIEPEELDEEEYDIIEHKNKEYFLIDNIVYRLKKDGDKGKKVGKFVNGKIKFTEKKKK